MSYDLTAYTDAPCDRALLVATFAERFPAHALEILVWDADGGQVNVALREASTRRASPQRIAAAVELARHAVGIAPALDVPKSSQKKLAGLRVGYTLSVRSEEEIAVAWVIVATIALSRGGFVDDPQDGVTSTASHAAKRAARIVREALTERRLEGADVDDDGPLPEHLAEERRSMFAASLRRHAEAGTFADLVESASLDAELLEVGLAFSSSADRADVSLVLARRAPPEVLAAHALEAARAPGLRSRLYLEHLIAAGALDDLSEAARGAVLDVLAKQREPELIALLRARPASSRSDA